eukprot:6969330-Pyramimonas_sp.AAC.1
MSPGRGAAVSWRQPNGPVVSLPAPAAWSSMSLLWDDHVGGVGRSSAAGLGIHLVGEALSGLTRDG